MSEMFVLFGTADEGNILSYCDTKDWSYKLYTITEILNDFIPTYQGKVCPKEKLKQ